MSEPNPEKSFLWSSLLQHLKLYGDMQSLENGELVMDILGATVRVHVTPDELYDSIERYESRYGRQSTARRLPIALIDSLADTLGPDFAPGVSTVRLEGITLVRTAMGTSDQP